MVEVKTQQENTSPIYLDFIGKPMTLSSFRRENMFANVFAVKPNILYIDGDTKVIWSESNGKIILVESKFLSNTDLSDGCNCIFDIPNTLSDFITLCADVFNVKLYWSDYALYLASPNFLVDNDMCDFYYDFFYGSSLT